MRAYFLAAVLILAGCQSAEEKQAAATGEFKLTNASMAQASRITKAARAKTVMQPGQWQTGLTVLSADLSALPADKRDSQMQAIKEQERNANGCRTADDLKPFDIDNLEQVTGAKCVFPHFNQVGGKIDVLIQCGEGADMTVLAGTGTLSRTGYDVTIDQVTGTKGAANYFAQKLHAQGKRTGNCVAKAG